MNRAALFIGYLAFAINTGAFLLTCLRGDWGLAVLNLLFAGIHAFFIAINSQILSEARS